MQPRRREHKIDTTGRPSRVKGKLVEAIAAAMHEMPGVAVRKNVRLRPIVGGNRTREIDVLIDGSVVGYPFRVALECKNERQVVGAPEIDAFVGKLLYVGIPPQQGVFVSIKGYTKGAVERARAAGVRLLVLTGLTEDRLRQVLHEAFQSVVYLVPAVMEWTVVHDVRTRESTEIGLFFDEQGNVAGTLADLAWRAWHEHELPSMLGTYHLDLRVPKGWRHVIAGRECVPISLAAKVHVYGIALGLRGVAHKHDLVNVETRFREKTHLSATFETAHPLQLGVLTTEDELSAAMKTPAASIQITSRVRLPRVAIGGLLWPPSENF